MMPAEPAGGGPIAGGPIASGPVAGDPAAGDPTVIEPAAGDAAAVDRALAGRRSIRQFLPRPVARTDLEAILAVASRAPSGTNMQPWQVTALTGAPLERLMARILAVWDDPAALEAHADPYPFYPSPWFEPYLGRRRALGLELYRLLGIGRGDRAQMHAQHGRNFRFFDAPVGLLFSIHRDLQAGSLLDYGMFLQAIMTAARARGLDTCPQAAFRRFDRLIAAALGWPDDRVLVCGMALGYADPQAIVNRLHSTRVPVSDFASFIGFEK